MAEEGGGGAHPFSSPLFQSVAVSFERHIHSVIRRFPSCLRLCFKASPSAKAFHMEISFIHTQILVHFRVSKTNFHMKGFALALALKQR